MKFKAKLRKIGNSFGIISHKNVITSFVPGEEIELNVITKEDIFNEVAPNVITERLGRPKKPDKQFSASSRFEPCPQHKGSMKVTCGCK